MNCPYCNQPTLFLTSQEFYGKDYGSNVYLCRPCDAYVGTHGNTKNPLGTMATPEIRRWRKAAHSIFDPLWKGRRKEMSRSAAYRWMQEAMNLPAEKAHIAMFDEQQCKRLIEEAKKERGFA